MLLPPACCCCSRLPNTEKKGSLETDICGAAPLTRHGVYSSRARSFGSSLMTPGASPQTPALASFQGRDDSPATTKQRGTGVKQAAGTWNGAQSWSPVDPRAAWGWGGISAGWPQKLTSLCDLLVFRRTGTFCLLQTDRST